MDTPDHNHRNTPALETVEAIYAAIACGEVAAALDLMSPDVVVRQSAGLPVAGDWHGRAGFSAMATAIFQSWPGFSVSPELMLGDDQTVFVLTRVRSSDGALDQPMVERWRVRDGQAIECQPFYFDTTAATAAATRGN